MSINKQIHQSAAAWAASPTARAMRGFTLVDLVIVLAIASILISIAAPSFGAFIASQRASSAATDLYAALATARTEATKRNTNVTLSPAAGGWQNGWVVEDPAIVGRNVLTHGALASAVVTGPNTVVYQRSGRIRGAAPAFTLTFSTGVTDVNRCVATDISGRPYIKPC